MFFGRSERKTRENIEKQISDLLSAMEFNRTPGAEGAAYNTAGDLYAEAGHADQALSYYGLSIDAYLKVERWDAAAAVCRKVVRLSPGAVRARCTLAWLAIGKQLPAEAQVQIRGYVDAAVKAGREPLAVAQLKRMGDAASNPSVREEVTNRLLQLGADRAADHVFGTILRDRNVSLEQPSEDLLWSTVRRAALMGPSELVARR